MKNATFFSQNPVHHDPMLAYVLYYNLNYIIFIGGTNILQHS